MSELANSIRKIAGVEELSSRLKEAEERLAILGKRAISFQNTDGSVSTVGGTPGSTTLGDVQNSFGTSNSNTGNSAADDTKDPTKGGNVSSTGNNVENAENLLDGLGDDSIGSVLNGLSGLHDCQTGADISTDVMFKPNFKTPQGWPIDSSTPDTIAPVPQLTDDTWQSGFFWAVSGSVQSGPGASSAANDYAQAYNSAQQASSGDTRMSVRVVAHAGTPPSVYDIYSTITTLSTGVSIESFDRTVNRNPCAGGAIDGDALCPTTAPTLKSYPDSYKDRTSQIRKRDGKFIGTSLEPTTRELAKNNPAYTEGAMSMTFCTANGRQVTIEMNSLGGQNVFETLPGSTSPVGDVRVYDSNNKLVAKTDVVGAQKYQIGVTPFVTPL